jgi:hypothetical protein
LCCFRKSFDPESIFFVRTFDRHAFAARELRSPGGMIEVRVSQQNFLERQPFPIELRDDLIQITAGIDDGGLPIDFAPHNGAVLLKGSDGNDERAHLQF